MVSAPGCIHVRSSRWKQSLLPSASIEPLFETSAAREWPPVTCSHTWGPSPAWHRSPCGRLCPLPRCKFVFRRPSDFRNATWSRVIYAVHVFCPFTRSTSRGSVGRDICAVARRIIVQTRELPLQNVFSLSSVLCAYVTTTEAHA